MTVDEAYAACARVARGHYENFPVASLLLPPPMRPHIAAIYAFARAADDFADEGDRTADERLRLLDDWHARLTACVAGEAGDDPVFVALGETIRTCALPVGLFEDLLSAFRQDVTTTRYASWADVCDYCRRSANPVGRLVLRVSGRADDRLDAASDAVCTALQLTNFWQDLERDWRKGRIYVPREALELAGRIRAGPRRAHDHARLARGAARTWRLAPARCSTPAAPCATASTGRLRYELRFTWLGGRRILDRLEAAGFDVFAARPTLGAADFASLAWQAVAWRPAGNA